MPFDGIVTKSIVKELSETIVDGRIEKIFQPERDEIIINLRAKGQNLKLVLSASANYPRIHITEASKENPSIPPVFCMLLRKHLSGGKILGIEFYDYERIISILIESTNELGDLSVKRLIIEIMGRYSNIILVNSEDKIIDSIKHVDNEISSVREIMPARSYVFPPSQKKTSPELLDLNSFIVDAKNNDNVTVEKYLLNNIKGFSPLLCSEICYRADIDNKAFTSGLIETEIANLKKVLSGIIAAILENDYNPCIIYDVVENKPVDFHCLDIYQNPNKKHMSSISGMLDIFYSTKDKSERLKQKKSDVLKVLNNSLDRCNKKLFLQQEKLREVSDREKLKLYGELITANIYCIPAAISKVSLLNYYSENSEYIDINLDKTLSPQQNAQKYYKQYSKAKSAFSYTSRQLEDTLKELDYLESVLQLLENCVTLQEIDEVRQELNEQGYLHSSRSLKSSKKPLKASAPLHFKSTDGLDIFVGKNNKQNDYLTLKFASSNDMWFHTKNIPGSHVVIRKLQQPISDKTLVEASILAAYHSKAKTSSNVPVDFTTVKNVKKPHGAKPGMVIYENYKTIAVTPDENIIKNLILEK